MSIVSPSAIQGLIAQDDKSDEGIRRIMDHMKSKIEDLGLGDVSDGEIRGMAQIAMMDLTKLYKDRVAGGALERKLIILSEDIDSVVDDILSRCRVYDETSEIDPAGESLPDPGQLDMFGLSNV